MCLYEQCLGDVTNNSEANPDPICILHKCDVVTWNCQCTTERADLWKMHTQFCFYVLLTLFNTRLQQYFICSYKECSLNVQQYQCYSFNVFYSSHLHKELQLEVSLLAHLRGCLLGNFRIKIILTKKYICQTNYHYKYNIIKYHKVLLTFPT